MVTMSAPAWKFYDEREHPETWRRHYRYNDQLTVPNGLKIVSVTQALGILSKDFLGPWKENMALQGAHALTRPGTPYRRCPECNGVSLLDVCEVVGKDEAVCGGRTRPYRLPYHWRGLQADLRSARLDADSNRDDAAIRGTNVHTLHEDWVNHGKVPNPSAHPEAWRGYIVAMARYMMACEKAGETPESSEAVVGSVIHGFAGQCDTVALTKGKDGKRERRDFKTSKQVYARSNFRQLGAYELADVEGGSDPTDDLAVVILEAGGEFRIARASEVEWRSSPAQAFLNALETYRDDQPLKKHEDETYKARAAREKAAKQKTKEAA